MGIGRGTFVGLVLVLGCSGNGSGDGTPGTGGTMLLPRNGTIYWVSESGFGGATYFQNLPDGMRTKLTAYLPSSLTADANYLYGTVGKDIQRFTP